MKLEGMWVLHTHKTGVQCLLVGGGGVKGREEKKIITVSHHLEFFVELDP